MTLEIKQVTSDEDLLKIVPLKAEIDSEFYRDKVSLEVALKDIIEIRDDCCDFWLAKQNGKVIGYAVGDLRDNEEYYSEGICVKKEYRNQGIGYELKMEMVKFAKELGCKRICTILSKTNQPSLRMQEKAGFTIKPYDGGSILLSSLEF